MVFRKNNLLSYLKRKRPTGFVWPCILIYIMLFLNSHIFAQDSTKIELKKFRVSIEEVLPFFSELVDTVGWIPSKKHIFRNESNDDRIIITTISRYKGPLETTFQLVGDTLFLTTSGYRERVQEEKRVYRNLVYDFSNFYKKNKFIFFDQQQVYPIVQSQQISFRVTNFSKFKAKSSAGKEDGMKISKTIKLQINTHEEKNQQERVIRNYSDGVLDSWSRMKVSGESLSQKYYSADNILVHESIERPDLEYGEKYDTKYSLEGNIIEEKFFFKDTVSGVYKIQYFENGIIKNQYTYLQDSITIIRNYQNGNIKFKGKVKNKKFLTRFYNNRKSGYYGGFRNLNQKIECYGTMLMINGVQYNKDQTPSKKVKEEICSSNLR